MVSMAARLALFVLFSFATVNVRAEYRVYELVIENENGQGRTVLSTLDDLQYSTYNPVKKNETIKLQDSWMCWERNDLSQDVLQKYCPNPRAPASAPAGPKSSAK
jgi:hypothetical protein